MDELAAAAAVPVVPMEIDPQEDAILGDDGISQDACSSDTESAMLALMREPKCFFGLFSARGGAACACMHARGQKHARPRGIEEKNCVSATPALLTVSERSRSEPLSSLRGRGPRLVARSVSGAAMAEAIVNNVLAVTKGDATDDAVYQAVTQLAQLVDRVDGEAAWDLCAVLRDEGVIEALGTLVSHAQPPIHQTALMLLAELTTEDVDPDATETKQRIKDSGTFSKIVTHLFSNVALTVAVACAVVQNTCADEEMASMIARQGGVERLRELTRLETPQIRQAAEACLHNLSEAVSVTQLSIRVTVAVVKMQRAVRRLVRRPPTTLHPRMPLGAQPTPACAWRLPPFPLCLALLPARPTCTLYARPSRAPCLSNAGAVCARSHARFDMHEVQTPTHAHLYPHTPPPPPPPPHTRALLATSRLCASCTDARLTHLAASQEAGGG